MSSALTQWRLLPEPKKAVLLRWLALVAEPAEKGDNYSVQCLRWDFQKDAFPVSEDIFLVALERAGLRVWNRWRWSTRMPTLGDLVPCTRPRGERGQYLVRDLGEKEQEEFEGLLEAVKVPKGG
jgi:hypothetical protein